MTGLDAERRRARVRSLERGVGLVLLVYVALLHMRTLLCAGALWRDEVNTVNVAGQPTLHEFWSALEFDSYPALWPIVLRAWLTAGGGSRDLYLRFLGCAIGLCVLAALWWSARQFSGRTGWPGLSWILLGASPVLLKWGDSLRALGLGMVLGLLATGAIWKLVAQPSRRNFVVAALTALLSVHALYYNSVLLLVLCASGTIVGIRRRDWRLPALLLGLGLVCALSLLPYLPLIAGARDWGRLAQIPVSGIGLAQRFGEALQASGDVTLVVWILLWAGALVGCAMRSRSANSGLHDRAVFLGCCLCLGPLAYLGFLMALSYQTSHWYYLSLMGFLIVAMDASWELVMGDSVADRIGRVACCLLLAACMATPAWQAAGQRRTTVDLSAAVLKQRAAADDLIVLANWAPGITFSRYFQGTTPWITLPDIADHTVHRYDLVARKMEEPDPLRDVRKRSSETLKSGHRVWVLGYVPFQLAVRPRPLSPVPWASTGWQEAPYARQWQAEVGYFLKVHAVRIELILPPAPTDQADSFENLPLYMASGWH